MPCAVGADDPVVAGWLEAVGTGMVIGASFVSTFGINLQKWAHNRSKRNPVSRPAIQDWRWWAGMAGIVLGSLLDLAALPFVPQSRVAALGSVGIVVNVAVAPMFLGEKLTGHDLVGCAVLCVGTTLATVFGAGREPEVDSSCVLQYFTKPLFVGYAAGQLVLLAGGLYLILGLRRISREATAAGLCHSFDTIWASNNLAKLLPLAERIRPLIFLPELGPQFYPFVVAGFAGIVGANSIMFAKTTMIFFKNAITGEISSMGWLSLFLPPFGICLLLQIFFLNYALEIYPDALFVLPCYQSFWIVFGIAAGLIFYEEWTQLEGWHIALFAVGVAVSLAGMAILSMRSSRPADEPEAGANSSSLDPNYVEFGSIGPKLDLQVEQEPYEPPTSRPAAGSKPVSTEPLLLADSPS